MKDNGFPSSPRPAGNLLFFSTLTTSSSSSVEDDTDNDYLGQHRHQDSLPAGPDQGCDGKEAKDADTDNDYTTDTIDTDNDYTIGDTAMAHFLFLIPPHKPSAPTPEPTWKTLKMLRKKKRGTRYPSTTGKTHSTSPPTPRMTTRLLPPPASTTPDHDYISDDRNDGPPQPLLRQRLRPRHARAGGLALA